jgi:hypothetical protein
MAGPLSITASIIVILQLTSTVVQYIGIMTDSEKSHPEIRDEISNTSFLLYGLKDWINQIRECGSVDDDQQRAMAFHN